MKTFAISALTFLMAAILFGSGTIGAVMPAQECTALSAVSITQATCLDVKLSTDLVAPRVVTLVTVDPKTVAAMPALSQVDTVLREVVEVAK